MAFKVIKIERENDAGEYPVVIGSHSSSTWCAVNMWTSYSCFSKKKMVKKALLTRKTRVSLSVKNIKLQAKFFFCTRSCKRSYKGWNTKQKISSATV